MTAFAGVGDVYRAMIVHSAMDPTTLAVKNGHFSLLYPYMTGRSRRPRQGPGERADRRARAERRCGGAGVGSGRRGDARAGHHQHRRRPIDRDSESAGVRRAKTPCASGPSARLACPVGTTTTSRTKRRGRQAAEKRTERIAHGWEKTSRGADKLANKAARKRARQVERDQWERTLKDGCSPTRASQRNIWRAGQAPRRQREAPHTGGQVQRTLEIYPPDVVAVSTAHGSSIGEHRRVYRTSCLGRR